METEIRATTADLLQRAHKSMPGGVLSTFVMDDDHAVIVDRGLGSRIWDVSGREYIDYILGSGPLILGHAYPDVVEAVTAQMARGSQFYALNETAIRLAEKIVSASPCADRVKFTSTGADATFLTLRLARAFTGRSKILRFGGAYHGHHDYGMHGFSAGIPETFDDVVVTATFNDIQSVRDLLAQNEGQIAAVIVEPLQRSVAPRAGFLEGLRDITREHEALLIFDEVVTGFRLAWGGAQEYYGVVPDLAAYGKIIGGGLPLGAVAGSAEILELTNPRAVARPNYAYFSGTLNGNPLAAAAGLATLNVLEDRACYSRLANAGEYVRSRLRAVIANTGVSALVLGDGPMVGVVFGEGDPNDPGTIARGDRQSLQEFQRGLLERGSFVNFLGAKMYISLAHSTDDLDATLQAAADVLEARRLT